MSIEIRSMAVLITMFFMSGCQVARPSMSANPTQVATLSPSEPTWTPLPTLSSVEAISRITELLRNNAECELPCWWGLVPGEMSWNSARQSLAPLVSKIGEGESRTYTQNGVSYFVENFDVQYIAAGHSDLGLINFGVVNGVVDVIWVLPRGTETRYRFSQFVSVHDKPEKIWIEVDPDTNLFHLLLHYPSQGITALYEGQATKGDSDYELCLREVGPELWLWTPGKVFVQNDDPFIGPDFGLGPGGHEKHMRTIEAAGLSSEVIIQSFGGTDSECITTSRNLWEAP